jgi:hypothetical protein
VIVAAFNFTPVPRHGYLVGVDQPGDWREILNSDAAEYGGSGVGNQGRSVALEVPVHGRSHSLALTLPPLGAVFLAPPLADAAQERLEEAEALEEEKDEDVREAAAAPAADPEE